MNNCYMIRQSLDGGGNGAVSRPIVVRRTAAIGDSLCASVVADKLADLGYEVHWQTHASIHCVMRRRPRISFIGEPNAPAHVNLDGAYEKNALRRQRHFHQMFIEEANRQLQGMGISLGAPLNCRPRLFVPRGTIESVQKKFSVYARPWVFVVPRSDHYNVRQVMDGVWESAAARIQGTKFWLGRHPAPGNFIDLKAQHMDNVIEWLTAADLVISVDTGPMHIAAALGVPILALGQSSSPELHLGDQDDFLTIWPGNLTCINCQQNVCPISQYQPPCQNFDPAFIAHWANLKLMQKTTENVSAIVAIYKPDVRTLNRCLECLLPQVQEIIVTGAGDSVRPAGSIENGKVRYVRKSTPRIGYGRNANFGARHSTGKYLLLINDDVFLDPGAVENMLAEIRKPGVGLVANLLRYPDGTIYHAGKSRSPNVRGWGHIDHRQRDHSIKGPLDMENVCMACSLVTREAFYRIGGFDEEYFLFAEDDDFCLRLRKEGYRIIFTPHSTGVHVEHQSVNKVGDIQNYLSHANATFDRKWGKYLTANATRIPGSFDYLNTA